MKYFGRPCCKSLLWLVVALSFTVFQPCPAWATRKPLVVIEKNKRISASVEQVSIADILKSIEKKLPLRIVGDPPIDQVDLQFSNASLSQAVRKIMRGFNYVLIESGVPGGTMLAIVGKAEWQGDTGKGEPADAVSPEGSPQEKPAAQSREGDGEPEQAPEKPPESDGGEPAPAPAEPPGNHGSGAEIPPPDPPPSGEPEGPQDELEIPPATTSRDAADGEQMPVDTGKGQQPDPSEGVPSPLGLLRKDNLDTYFGATHS